MMISSKSITRCTESLLKTHSDTLTNNRTVARQIQQINELQEEKGTLLGTLRTLIDGPSFAKRKHTDVIQLVNKG